MPLPQGFNSSGVAFEAVRFGADALDEKIITLSNALVTAYFDFWKNEQSRPWLAWNVITTGTPATRPQRNREQYDLLYGALWNIYPIVFDWCNARTEAGGQADPERWRYIRDDDGNLIEDRLATAKAWLQTVPNAKGVNLQAALDEIERLFPGLTLVF